MLSGESVGQTGTPNAKDRVWEPEPPYGSRSFAADEAAFSLLDTPVPEDLAKRRWTAGDRQKYRHFLEERRRMEALERRNIAEWLRCQPE